MSTRIEKLLESDGEQLRTVGTSTRHAIEHNGEFGRALEGKLSSVLRQHLPRRFAVTTGFVVGPGDFQSRQQDILIYDTANYPSYPYPAGSEPPTGNLVIPESLCVVVSVKSALRPGDMTEHFNWANETKQFVNQALGHPWSGLAVVVAFRSEGDVDSRRDAYFARSHALPQQLDLVCTLDSELLFNAARFGVDRDGELLRHHGDLQFDAFSAACLLAPRSQPFLAFYQVLLSALLDLKLRPLPPITEEWAAAPAAPLPALEPHATPPPPQEGFHSEYFAESEFLLRKPGDHGQFAIGFVNRGSAPWVKGRDGQQATLATSRPLFNTEDFASGWADGWLAPDRYAAQDADVVLPGQIGFFIYNFRVPTDAATGLHYFYLQPIIEAFGPMEDQGAYQVVNVQRDGDA